MVTQRFANHLKYKLANKNPTLRALQTPNSTT